MKVYVKPEIRIERFNLSKHIAACAYDLSNLTDKTVTCYAVGDPDFDKEGQFVFTSASNICNITEDQSEFYCYTTGSSDMNIYNS